MFGHQPMQIEFTLSPQGNSVAHLRQHISDIRALLQVPFGDAAPDAQRVVIRAFTITIIAEHRTRIEDAHTLPEHQLFGWRVKYVFSDGDRVHAPIEPPAKEPEREAIIKSEFGGRRPWRLDRLRQPDEEAACPGTALPDEDDHQQRREARQISLPGEGADDTGDTQHAQAGAQQPRAVNQSLAIPAEQIIMMVHWRGQEG